MERGRGGTHGRSWLVPLGYMLVLSPSSLEAPTGDPLDGRFNVQSGSGLWCLGEEEGGRLKEKVVPPLSRGATVQNQNLEEKGRGFGGWFFFLIKGSMQRPVARATGEPVGIEGGRQEGVKKGENHPNFTAYDCGSENCGERVLCAAPGQSRPRGGRRGWRRLERGKIPTGAPSSRKCAPLFLPRWFYSRGLVGFGLRSFFFFFSYMKFWVILNSFQNL